MLQLILIRGLPGSGKTTLAEMLREGFNYLHLEADKYFQTKDGWVFRPELLPEAHKVCQNLCEMSLKDDQSVIVANTFVSQMEIQPYLNMAKRHNAVVQLIECHGQFKNVHNVPESTIQKMKERWERIVL